MYKRQAQDQLRKGGYDSLNFTKIGESVNTSRANMHHHFKNKEGLAIAATESFIKEGMSFIYSLEARKPGDFPNFLKELETEMLAHIKESGRGCPCICSQIIQDANVPPSLLKVAMDHFDFKHQFMMDLIKKSQKNNKINPNVKPEFLANTTRALILGISQIASLHDSGKDFSKSVKGVLTGWIKNYQVS